MSAASVISAMEKVAARGADGLDSAAREKITGALQALRRPDGGFAGLDGRSDLYFTFFAWQSLRALGSPPDRESLCAFCARGRRSVARVERCCAELVLLREGWCRRRARWLAAAALAARGVGGRTYDAFLFGLLADSLMPAGLPRWLARLLWRHLPAGKAWDRLPTPQLAALVVLAAAAERIESAPTAALVARRADGGGYRSAADDGPDLLATAAARFALGWLRPTEQLRDSAATEEDAAFVEACWMDDGLFGASPAASRGDSEHSFYALLALGTCRA